MAHRRQRIRVERGQVSFLLTRLREIGIGKVLSTHKVSSKPSPANAAPVEVMFAPKANPPMLHITNMCNDASSFWTRSWYSFRKGEVSYEQDGHSNRGDDIRACTGSCRCGQ